MAYRLLRNAHPLLAKQDMTHEVGKAVLPCPWCRRSPETPKFIGVPRSGVQTVRPTAGVAEFKVNAQGYCNHTCHD